MNAQSGISAELEALRAENSRLRAELEKRDRAVAVAQAALRAKNEYLNKLSHELRTPLAGMMLWTKLLSGQNERPSGRLQEGLAALRECAAEQQQLIERLAETSRMSPAPP